MDEYTKKSDLQDDLTAKSSLLNEAVFTDTLDFDQQFEGIPDGTPVGGRQASTIADAINADGNLVNDVINTNIDTSAKNILGSFTFSGSGALDISTDADNGLWISPTGILAKKSGSNTVAIENDGTATFTGTISGGSLNINNKAIITSAGDATFKSYNLISQYTAGEGITEGHLVCLRHKICSWGDEVNADRNLTTTFSALTYVNQEAATTNYGATTTPKLGRRFYFSSGITYYNYILGKIDFTPGTTGLPAWNEVDRVWLRIYVVFACTTGHPHTVVLQRCTTNWAEDTVTWNTKPDVDGVSISSAVGTGIFNETMASVGTLNDDGYIEFDITDLYRLWQSEVIDNYGFCIIASEGSNFEDVVPATMGGRTREGGGNFNQAPYLKIIPTVNNPGSGNTITVNDGKIYHASCADYNLAKNIVGIASETVAADATCDVYSLADRSIVPSVSVTTGKTYYLTSTDGSIGTLTNDIITPDTSGLYKWNLKIGIGTPTGLCIDFGKNPVFIKSSKDCGEGVLPPPHSRMAIVVDDEATPTVQSILYKDAVTAAPLATWGNGTVATTAILTTTTGYTIYWYK